MLGLAFWVWKKNLTKLNQQFKYVTFIQDCYDFLSPADSLITLSTEQHTLSAKSDSKLLN